MRVCVWIGEKEVKSYTSTKGHTSHHIWLFQLLILFMQAPLWIARARKKKVKDMPVYINVSISVSYDSLVGCSCFWSKMYSKSQNWILVRMRETDTKYIWLSFGDMFLRWCKGLLSHADSIRRWDVGIMLCSGMISLQMQQQKMGGS